SNGPGTDDLIASMVCARIRPSDDLSDAASTSVASAICASVTVASRIGGAGGACLDGRVSFAPGGCAGRPPGRGPPQPAATGPSASRPKAMSRVDRIDSLSDDRPCPPSKNSPWRILHAPPRDRSPDRYNLAGAPVARTE